MLHSLSSSGYWITKKQMIVVIVDSHNLALSFEKCSQNMAEDDDDFHFSLHFIGDSKYILK
jgi:hypothetical protein